MMTSAFTYPGRYIVDWAMRTVSGTSVDIRDSILDAVGDTPLVRLSRLGKRPDRAARGEGRGAEPGRVDQGPRRDRADRGRGARREAEARRHDRRAHQRQHRHRPRHRGGAQGLPRDRRDAGQDVEGEDRPAARVRRRGRGGAHRGAARVARVVLPRGRPAHRGDPRRLPAEPVPEPGEPGGALPLDRARDLAARPAARSRTSWRAWAPAARSPARAATCASRTRTSRSSARTPSARSTPAARTA